MNYSGLTSSDNVSANQHIPGRKSEMKRNLAGGVSFEADNFTALRRWLLTGSFSNLFYESKSKNITENLDVLIKCIEKDPEKVADEIVYASNHGTMASQHTCILALVFLSKGNLKAKRAFRSVFNSVVRTASHLYEFVGYVKEHRGMGKTIHKAVNEWIKSKDYNGLEYQFLKYQKREGFSNRDILRLFKPAPRNEIEDSLFAWIAEKDKPLSNELKKISAFEAMKSGNLSEDDVIKLINNYSLTHEMIPSNVQRTKSILEALFYKMPLTATIRNLATLTRQEVLTVKNLDFLEEKLSKENIKKSHLHPIEIANAKSVYESGGLKGRSGNSEYIPIPRVSDILEQAVNDSFETLEETGASFFHALDVSGSMLAYSGSGLFLNCFEIETIIALATIKSEKNYFIGAFSDIFKQTPGVTKSSNINSALNYLRGFDFSGTNAARAYEYAIRNNIFTDVFVFWTDNENWQGAQPSLRLAEYRDKVNPNAKAVYVTIGAYSDNITLSDPKDPNSYDIVGFSSETPKIISMIAKGEI